MAPLEKVLKEKLVEIVPENWQECGSVYDSSLPHYNEPVPGKPKRDKYVLAYGIVNLNSFVNDGYKLLQIFDRPTASHEFVALLVDSAHVLDPTERVNL